MNFSISSGYGLLGAIVIVSLGVVVLIFVAGLARSVMGGRKSIQEIEADQIEREAQPLDGPGPPPAR